MLTEIPWMMNVFTSWLEMGGVFKLVIAFLETSHLGAIVMSIYCETAGFTETILDHALIEELICSE